jgi:hypothetical protein
MLTGTGTHLLYLRICGKPLYKSVSDAVSQDRLGWHNRSCGGGRLEVLDERPEHLDHGVVPSTGSSFPLLR